MGLYCFGIDVGGTTVKCGLFQTDGNLVDKWEIPTRTENKGENILPDVAKAIQDKMAEKGIEKADVEGVGIGIPGPINSKGEAACAVNLYWGFTPVAQILHDLTGLKACAGNDANVAALGEAWKGAAAGSDNVIMVTLGTGVGGGIIVDGKIVAGTHGAGGEIGHVLVVRGEAEKCNCGNHGCLEQYASATGIVRVAGRMLAASEEDSTLRGLQNITAKDVLDAFKEGDALAVRTMEYVGDLLGGALAGFAAVVDPEAIVIGGGVVLGRVHALSGCAAAVGRDHRAVRRFIKLYAKAGQPLIDCIQKYYMKYAFPSCKDTQIVLATLGNDAGICGAAKMVL